MITGAANLRQRSRELRRGYFGQRPPWGLREWALEKMPAIEFENLDPIEAWLDALRSTAGSAGNLQPVIDSLQSSRLLAFEPAGIDGGERVWNVSWCLKSRDSLSDQILESLRASNLLPFAAQREREADKAAGGEGVGWFRKGFYAIVHGVPSHLWTEGAPVVAAPIGQSRSTHLPRGLSVPTGFGELRSEVETSLNDLVTAARHGLEIAREEGNPLTAEETAARQSPRNWLEHEDGCWRVHPDAKGGAAFIAAAANRQVPEFLSQRYRLEVGLRPVDEWVGGNGQALELRLRERRDDARVVESAIEELADGLRLWVQLALLQACEQASRVASELLDRAGEWWIDAQQAEGRDQEDRR